MSTDRASVIFKAIRVREEGVVPCKDCQKAHVRYDVERPGQSKSQTWAHPDDGHAYKPMDAVEAMRFFAVKADSVVWGGPRTSQKEAT